MRLTSVNPIILLALLLLGQPAPLMSQPDSSETRRWLANADLVPTLATPGSKREWQREREKIRTTLWQLLGKLPPRPKIPAVKLISREDRGDFVVEKFSFDNSAGATVP
ncbi:MAG TPA: hypothetical protein VL793_13325, partial [Patescibacteria group bacterium]|nr:hypothetical protein [Patescibacteria group bacterium]